MSEIRVRLEGVLIHVKGKKCSICWKKDGGNLSPTLQFSTCLSVPEEKQLQYKFHHYFCTHCATEYLRSCSTVCLECKRLFSKAELDLISAANEHSLLYQLYYFESTFLITDYTKEENKLLCIICQNYYNKSDILQPTHNIRHSICHQCFVSYVSNLSNTKIVSWASIMCPYISKKSCHKSYTQKEIVSILPSHLYKTLESNFTRYFHTECYNCKTLNYHAITSSFDCINCHQKMCSYCGKQTCDCQSQLIQKEKSSIIEQFHAVQCPFCNILIIQESGCLELKCFCGGSFCTLCFAPMVPIQMHGNQYHYSYCGLYSKPEKAPVYNENCMNCKQSKTLCSPPITV